MRARVFLVFTIIGFLTPPILITYYVIDQGAFDAVDMLNAMVDNTIALAVFCDLTLSALCFFYWASYEGPRLGIKRWWWTIPATFIIGLCFALPLFMYWRERALESQTE